LNSCKTTWHHITEGSIVPINMVSCKTTWHHITEGSIVPINMVSCKTTWHHIPEGSIVIINVFRKWVRRVLRVAVFVKLRQRHESTVSQALEQFLLAPVRLMRTQSRTWMVAYKCPPTEWQNPSQWRMAVDTPACGLNNIAGSTNTYCLYAQQCSVGVSDHTSHSLLTGQQSYFTDLPLILLLVFNLFHSVTNLLKCLVSSTYNYHSSGHYPLSCLLFNHTTFGNWIPSPSVFK
jgi:hypothetical protein